MIWLEIFAVLAMAIAGARIASRLSPSRWAWGVLVPSGLLVLIFFTHRIPWLQAYFPFSWLTGTKLEPPLLACSIVLLFSTLISRMPRERMRALAATLTAVLVTYHAFLPLAMPLALRPAFATMVTRIDDQGVCLQTQLYTCGPAAAVTSLRALGIPADEAALTIESRCRPPLGVDSQALAIAINRLYGSQGIAASCRWFASIDTLPLHAIASIQWPGGNGHAVAILEISPEEVVLGDPSTGICRMPRAVFRTLWTGVAVEIARTR